VKTVSIHDAIALGLKTYRTGEQCKHGHLSDRYVSNSKCVECTRISSKAFDATEARVKAKAQYYLENKDRITQRNKTYVSENREVVAERHRAYSAKNKDKLSDYNKSWSKANRWLVAAKSRKYQAAKLKRTPSWLTSVDLFEMECVYQYADALRNVGLDYHVDHVIPLQGKLVSGLHVPENLQVIRAFDNVSKSNKYTI
jgi:hypothetical protein